MLREAAVMLQMPYLVDWNYFGHIQAKNLQTVQKNVGFFGKKLNKSTCSVF